MVIGPKTKRPISLRHQHALDYAMDQIRKSPLSQYVVSLYLYGSCVRQTAEWGSDVDLFLELSPDIPLTDENREELMRLRAVVTDDDPGVPELDLKFVIGPEWKSSRMLYYQNVRKDGIDLWG